MPLRATEAPISSNPYMIVDGSGTLGTTNSSLSP
jgi:hypothetical protein